MSNETMSHYQHDYSKFDQEGFLADFNNLDFEYLDDNQSDVDVKFNRFLASLDAIVQKHAPLKKFTCNELNPQNKPWINKRIREMMQFKDKLLKNVKKKPDTATKLLYKKVKNRVANELRESKKKYFHKYFTANSNNMKLL